jgi:very-short-patch-repair endonuclease
MALANSHDPEFYPYKLTPSLLTASEAAFYVALLLAAGQRYVVFAKVRLADLCRDLDRWADTRAFNQVSSKHVDFVLCDAATFRPVLAVELDDRSHLRANRHDRDALVDRIFRTMGLGVYRQWVRRTYDPAAIARGIEEALTP